MTTPFRAFQTPDLRSTDPEALALGFGLGAAVGTIIPTLAAMAELAGGSTLTTLVSAPSPAMVITLLAPVAAGVAGALCLKVLQAHRLAYDEISEKAASLMDETFDLRTALDGQPVMSLPEATSMSRPVPQLDRPSHEAEPTAPAAPMQAAQHVANDDLATAQAHLLASFGEATQDTARRMHVNLQGLRLAGLSAVQERLVDALDGHLDGLWDLADDVVVYAEEDASLTPQPTIRAVKPQRPPKRVAA